MITAMRLVLFPWLVFVSVPSLAQEAMDYRSTTANPQANFYTIATQTDSLLKTLPPDTLEESQGLLFARWKWFWEARMGDAIDGAKTGKFTHYMGVMKSMVQSPPCLSPSAYPANWNLLGPIQLPRQEMGRIDAVALDPNNPSVAYAGAPNGGLWRTTDIDAAVPLWQNITDQAALPGMGIGDILIDPSNSDIIYIATGFYTGGFGGGVGVLKTTNGTDPLPTWEFTGLNYNPFLNEVAVVKKLVMSPTDHNTLFAYTGKEVYKTMDAGATWSSLGLNAVVNNAALEINDLVLDPLDNASLVVSLTKPNAFLWRWDSSTAQWTDLTTSLSATPRPYSPAVGTRYPVYFSRCNNDIYVLYETASDNRIDVSHDGGITWSLHVVADNYGPWFIVSPSNADIMYLGDGTGRVIFKSVNGGASFIAVSVYWPTNTYHGVYMHGDIRALELLTSSANGLSDILMAGTDGGVLYSTSAEPPPNEFVNWRNVNGSGLAVGQFYGLAGSEKVPGRIIGGAQDNGLATYDADAWSNQVVGDAYNVVIDHESPDNAYGEKIDYGGPPLGYGHYLIKSTNGGQLWPSTIPQPPWGNPSNTDNYLPGNIPFSPDIWNVLDSPFQLDHENKMYIGFHDLFRYNPAINSWTPLSDFTIPAVTPDPADDPNALPVYWQCSAFAIAPSKPDVIYFAFGGQTWSPDNLIKHKLWKTEDGGVSWSDVTHDLPVNWYAISGIVVDPEHVDRVWVSFGAIGSYGSLAEPYNGSNRVYYTSDGGATWTDYSLGLTPLPINTIVYETGSNDGLYVGTDVGVFYTNRSLYNSDNITDPQNTGWVCFNDDFPACIVTGLEINYSSNKLRASTYGRGIWESSLACPLDADLYFTTATAGLSSTFQEASNDISIVADAGDIDLSDFTGRAGNEASVSTTGSSSVHLGPGSHLFIHPCDGPDNSFHPQMEIASTSGGLGGEAEHDRETGVKVYPNPNDGKMTIELTQADRSDISQIRFVDPLGRVVFTGTMKGRVQTIDVNGLGGIYTLIVLQGKKQHLAKVVIN